MTGIRSWIDAISPFGVVVTIEHVRSVRPVGASRHADQSPANASGEPSALVM